MSESTYAIEYRSIKNVIFPSQTAMEKYLSRELNIWGKIAEILHPFFPKSLVAYHHGKVGIDDLVSTLSKLISTLDNRSGFNREASSHRRNRFLPPPADYVEGQLVRGLVEQELYDDAVSVLAYFLSRETDLSPQQSDRKWSRHLEDGSVFIRASKVAAALPFHNVSSAKIAGASRKAKNLTSSLVAEVEAAQETNESHKRTLAEVVSAQRQTADRINNAILYLNERRDREHKHWTAKRDEEVVARFREAELKIAKMERENTARQKAHNEEYNRLRDLYEAQLRIRAPVKLWESREELHGTKSKAAMQRFMGFGVASIMAAMAIPVLAGDYISASFFETVCLSENNCERVFSAKGPLMVTGLVLVLSIMMWVTRLQYRIHLSERHLSLDASEKKAFSEAFLALKEGGEVGVSNEAIILTSLFRPTQDGIIKDDEGGFDFSATTLLAKQLSKP